MTFTTNLRLHHIGLICLLAIQIIACRTTTRAVDAEPGSPVVEPPPDGQGDDLTPVADREAVVAWNEEALLAVVAGTPRPTVVSRTMFILHLAIYEAWAAYDDVALGVYFGADLKRPNDEHTDLNKTIAISYAAYRVLNHYFRDYAGISNRFDERLAAYGLKADDSTDTSTAIGIGNTVADAILADRINDGANEAGNYGEVTNAYFQELYEPVNQADPATERTVGGDLYDPNRWQPLRTPTGEIISDLGIPVINDDDTRTFREQTFLTPHWGGVQAFSLTSPNQFRPAPPPYFGSDEPYTNHAGETMTNDAAFRAQFGELLEYSANLTEERKVIAEYWQDGPRSETPPGHWLSLAHGISMRDKHGIDEDVKLYFALTSAIFDAGISCWESKRHYDFVRPATAIKFLYFDETVSIWLGKGQGIGESLGQNFYPYQPHTFVTPPFPEYTSGHSSFSAAAAEVLKLFTHSEAFYDGVTIVPGSDANGDGEDDFLGEYVALPDTLRNDIGGPAQAVTLRWNTFYEAAAEAGMSRLYGGIHIMDSNRNALDSGTAIGNQVFELASAYWNGTHTE